MINVKEEVGSVQTVEEFDALLEVVKVQRPAEYALKVENGEFDSFRKTLKGYKAPKPTEPVVEEATSEEPTEETSEVDVRVEEPVVKTRKPRQPK